MVEHDDQPDHVVDHLDQCADHPRPGRSAMTPDEARKALTAPVTFEHRSLYWSCSVCAALVWSTDRDQHRAAHEAMAALVDQEDR